MVVPTKWRKNARARVKIGLCPASRSAKFQRPDVLVNDIGIFEEDGYSLIRQMRAVAPERGGSTPVVGRTDYARSEDRLKVILAGFQMHMAKPVEAAELLAYPSDLSGITLV